MKNTVKLLIAAVFLVLFTFSSDGAGVSVVNLHSFDIFVNGEIPYSSLVQGANGNFYGTTFQGGSTGFGVIFEVASNGAVSTLYNFTNGADGAFPQAGLLLANDGNFYGDTVEGGTNDMGVIFRITPEGVFNSLYSFTALTTNNDNADGAYPAGSLIQAQDGNLYGTASAGGTNGSGTLFSISLSGSFQTLYSFSALDANGENFDGSESQASLMQGSDSKFYGTTSAGGTNGFGTVFKYDAAQNQISTLYTFKNTNDGANPLAALTQGRDGNFYGTASQGGSDHYGTLFMITNGGGFSALYSFTDAVDGADPGAPLIEGADGNFYGTSAGAPNYLGTVVSFGTVFSISTNGTFRPIYSFTNGIDGANPTAALVQTSEGSFFGTTSGGGLDSVGAIFSISPAGVFSPVMSFLGGLDGNDPQAPLVQGTNGNFYGTTYQGGSAGKGTIFEITSGGAFTSIYSFTNGQDGGFPSAGLTLGTDGNFYGECITGGAHDCGVLFRVTHQGVLTVLHSMNGVSQNSGGDGSHSVGALAQGTNGNFYGVATLGGNEALIATYSGTVFEMTLNGTVTSLYTFTNGADGSFPKGGLTAGLDGSFYGTTTSGGLAYKFPPAVPFGMFGSIFKITADGALTALYSFTNGVDGGVSLSKLIQLTNGTFYGTASTGGTNGHGTIFEITPSGTFTPFYSFTNGIDGAAPVAGLALGPDGNLYGTASSGGNYGWGTLFEISPTGNFTPLYSFTGGNDGSIPMAALVLGSDGNFYGTTSLGGESDSGTAFKLVLSTLAAPRLTSITVGSTATTITWSTVPNQSYQLQFSDDLTTGLWTNLGSPTNGTSGSAGYSDSASGILQRFYRVRSYSY